MRGSNQVSSYYPISLEIKGRRCVVVGGGQVALRKVKALLEHGAQVEVISPTLCPELSRLNTAGTISVLRKEYEPGDLGNAFIAIAATTDAGINREVAGEAKQQRILVNVVDTPELSDFIVPSYLCRGALTIAVATAGKSPALARKIRTMIEKDYGEEYASLVDLAAEVRSDLKKRSVKVRGDDWQQALDVNLLVELLRTGQREQARAVLLGNLENRKQIQS
jgi:precorrin-2 dehydrogenase/sirohydrochlorin ferrochelatase